MVKVIVLNEPALRVVLWIVLGLKLFEIVGGCRRMMPALALPPLEAPKPVVPGLYVNVFDVGVLATVESWFAGVL